MKDDVCNKLLTFFMLNPGGTAYVSPRTLEVLESETAVVKGNKNVTFRADDTLNYGTLVFRDKDGKETFTYEMPLCNTDEEKENEPKFTPGPWRHLKQYDHIGDFYRSYVCYGEPDAVNPDDSTFPPDQCICGCGRSHWQQNEANAFLIAAAPEMYDAEKDKIVHLQTLKNQIMSLLGMVNPIPCVTPEFTLNYIDQIIDDTEKLLERARGEA